MSVSEIGRILHFNDLRPHLVRYWLNTKDPDFGVKAERICEIYTHLPAGAKVFCIDRIDEMSVQALGRKHPSKVGPHAIVHEEYEYIRHGTCCAPAAFEVATGNAIVAMVEHRTAQATVEFLEKIATLYPVGEV